MTTAISARRWALRALALVVGAGLALAFPAADAWWLAWVGLVPLLLLLALAGGKWLLRRPAPLAAATPGLVRAAGGRGDRCRLGAVRAGCAPAPARAALGPAGRPGAGRAPIRVADDRGVAVLEAPGWDVGAVGPEPVSGAARAGGGVPRRGVADQLPAGHRQRRRGRRGGPRCRHPRAAARRRGRRPARRRRRRLRAAATRAAGDGQPACGRRAAGCRAGRPGAAGSASASDAAACGRRS